MTDSARPHLFGLLAGLFLAAGLILSAAVLARAWLYISESQVISVTGSASKEVTSDLIVWHGNFIVEDTTLVKAQERWAADLAKVETFLKERGITNYILDAVTVTELKSNPSKEGVDIKTIGYSLSQNLQITSTNISQVASLGREAIVLVQQGVLFTSSRPEFIYTKAGEAKIEMLADATKDAKARAEQIISQGGRKLGSMRSAKMGVFQITPRFSRETSSEGINDNTSLEKTIRAVVSASFTLK
jgi:hypothetical protein